MLEDCIKRGTWRNWLNVTISWIEINTSCCWRNIWYQTWMNKSDIFTIALVYVTDCMHTIETDWLTCFRDLPDLGPDLNHGSNVVRNKKSPEESTRSSYGNLTTRNGNLVPAKTTKNLYVTYPRRTLAISQATWKQTKYWQSALYSSN